MMPVHSASAPGKVILFGEHAVVYHRPAIAVPVSEIQATAEVHFPDGFHTGQITIDAPDIHLFSPLADLDPGHPFSLLFSAIKQSLSIDAFPPLSLHVTSTIPIAAGLGSGAAISVACARALIYALGKKLGSAEISNIAYEVEKYHHGTPSGIDNTVIAYAKPIFFIRDQPVSVLNVAAPFSLIVADCGIHSLTREAVGGVRQRWEADKPFYETIFDDISDLTLKAKGVILSGIPSDLGPLMSANHALLQKLGVSIPQLDRLVGSALNAGAWGAKLVGAGQGGNMAALVPDEKLDQVAAALHQAGAVRTFVSHIFPSLSIDHE